MSAIYGLGGPEVYAKQSLILDVGEERDQRAILSRLVELSYERNDVAFTRNKFRVRGDTIEVFPAYEERAVRIQLFGDEVERIASVDPLTGEIVEEVERLVLFPASHYVTDDDQMRRRSRASKPSWPSGWSGWKTTTNCSRRSACACAPRTTSR